MGPGRAFVSQAGFSVYRDTTTGLGWNAAYIDITSGEWGVSRKTFEHEPVERALGRGPGNAKPA